MRVFTDQLGHQITIPFPPKRIISLVPSQTELLYELGLGDQVVGITKFCVHPESWQKTKTIIGGTKKFRFDIIESLKPDLIIGNKEENYLEGIEELKSRYPVLMSDIVTLDDAFGMIQQIGDLVDTRSRSTHLLDQIKYSFSSIEKLPSFRTLYLIWQNPWMGAAPGTFIHEMMTVAGLQNCLSQQTRYPELSEQEIISLNPTLIFLSSEPYPFSQKHREEMNELFPTAKVVLVDGEMFSWYGSRLKKFPEYLKSLSQQLS